MTYLETTIEVINKRDEDILGYEHIMYVEILIDFDEICAVREVIDDDEFEVNPDKCEVYLRNGQYFTIFTKYKEVAKHLKQRQ